jgi:NADH-quinone oxidoreductase subunit H
MSFLDIGISVVQIFVIILGVSGAFAYLTLFERRLLARLQNRVGPNRAGPWGVLQPIADAVKLFFKEEVIPSQVDKVVYLLAPMLAVIPALIIWAVIPLGCWNIFGGPEACFVTDGEYPGYFRNLLQIADVNIGVLYLLAVTSIGVYGITLAGWGSNSKYSMLAGLRSSAQLVSYELSLSTAVLGAVMMSGSFVTSEIVGSQAGMWAVVPQFLGFVIFLMSATAELVRSPFDMVEAEQELTCGYNTEYSSMKFALFFMSEYVKMIALSAIGVMLYLGGWRFPGLETLGTMVTASAGPVAGSAVVGIVSLLAFLLKVAFFLFLLVWVRASWPRVRYDMLMNIGWKWMLPLALLNVVMTAVVTVLVPGQITQAIVLFVAGVVVLAVAAKRSDTTRVQKHQALIKSRLRAS